MRNRKKVAVCVILNRLFGLQARISMDGKKVRGSG
ncbi:hypothetical protein RUMOBE_00370 [Blautia obeum ATCC 29174]|uniref:Uncharacterized protein n=1 Tax=Blautia obeum ATCC 29174 TaxID=411459 RepID=A5ZN03_9FIRM|nr:hypothetical protein RUMOBE_00370 [Blautia obeum ATCC 29174]